MSTKKSEFGVFGLGVMGSSISLNIADKGYELSVFNRAEGGEEEVVNRFLSSNKHSDNIRGFTDLKAFIQSMERPRKILIPLSLALWTALGRINVDKASRLPSNYVCISWNILRLYLE